jgi:hypothetical protein
MTTLAEGGTRTAASSRKSRLVLSGIVLAFATPVGAGLTANLMRASLCPPDAWVCAGYGPWAQTLAQALPYLAFFPPLLILGVAVARSAALAWRVLLVYGAVLVLLLVPLWMEAAASYFAVTPRGIVRRDGPLSEGTIYRWYNVLAIGADCAAGTLGDAAPEFKLTLSDNTVLDVAAADGFVAHYPEISQALAGLIFIYDNQGARDHCPAPYLELFSEKPGKHS